MSIRWEYRVAGISREQVENQLNFMGNDGWELVQVIVMNNPDIPYQCIFKKPEEA